MKSKLIIIALVSISSVLRAQNIILADSKPTKATLFLSGAQVYRQAKVNLQKGSNIVKLTGLRQNINTNSIIVDGSNDFVIVSVEHKPNYIRAAQELPEYKRLSEELEKIKWELKKVQADKGILQEETNVLSANLEVKGSEETMNIERLMDYSDVYYEKSVDISIKTGELNKKEKDLIERSDKIRRQINELASAHDKYTSEIWVTLNANASGQKNISFNYYTQEAHWAPFYDIRTNDGDNKVSFVLKGKLLQYTGEKWEKINLTLSTGNPSLSTNLPTLSPWSIYSVKPRKYSGGGKGRSKAMSPAYDYGGAAPSEAKKLEEKEMDEIAYNQPIATAKNNLTTLEYTITEPYSLDGDNRYYDVDVISAETNGNKSYYTAPGYEQKAYMLTELPEWTKLNLLSGEAAMYFNDNYVGKIYLNTEAVEDTLNLSFGPDNNVMVSRRIIYSRERSQVVGSSRQVSRTIELTVRNSKSTAVEVDVDDQLPIAYNKSITVEKIDLAGAKHDEKTGYLNWKLKLQPGESKKIVFKYRVKYPKSSLISKF